MTEPMRVFPPAAPGKGAQPPAAGKKGMAAFLKSRNGKIGAGVAAAVVVFALYKRHQAAAATGTAATTGTAGTPTAGGTTADTTGSDLFNALEPIIENLSGFDAGAAINKSNADQTAALTQLFNGAQGTNTGTTPAGGHTYAAKEVATGPQTVLSFFKKAFPTANNTELQKLLDTTRKDPRNATVLAQLTAGQFKSGSTKVYLPAYTTAK